MMRSLWAGVSGLQAHQIAMDIEGNNIANVNTAGFKYSRANFSDMLSQTAKIATAPQGELGGKNPMQIGLGTQISSVTKIFKQGSVQTTDKNTDLAIQGDGFFVVSPDGGTTYKYTRNGDFNFDASGNFTDSNGYIIQGWLRDSDTGDIDATTPIANITIPPGLTTPAQDTSYITLKANLNSGDNIVNKSTIYSLDQHNGWVDLDGDGIKDVTGETHFEDKDDPIFNTDQDIYEKGIDFGTLFNASGEAIGIEEDQGIWTSYADSKLEMYASDIPLTTNISFDLNGETIDIKLVNSTRADNAADIASAINDLSNSTGIFASSDSDGKVTLINQNDAGTTDVMKNIQFRSNTNTGLFTDKMGTTAPDIKIITAFQYKYTKDAPTYNTTDTTAARFFHSTEDLRNFMQLDARNQTDYLSNGNDTVTDKELNRNGGVQIIVNSEGQYQITNPSGDAFNDDDGDYWDTSTSNEYDANNDVIISGTSSSYSASEAIGPITVGTNYSINLSAGSIIPSALAAEINIINGAQVDAYDISGTVETGDQYTINISGTPITHAVTTETTSAEIATALMTAINSNGTTSAIVTATTDSNGKLILTAVNPAATFSTTTGITNRVNVLTSAAATSSTSENAAETETNTVTFEDLANGESVTVGGLTLTATGGPLTAATIALAFSDLAASSDGSTKSDGLTVNTVINGVFTNNLAAGWETTGTSSTAANLAFTSTTAATNVANINATSASTDTTVVTLDGDGVGVNETADITYANLLAGESLTIDGLTLTATANISAAAVQAGFASLLASAGTGNVVAGGTWSGALSAAWASDVNGDFTNNDAGFANVADISVTGTKLPIVVETLPGEVGIAATQTVTFTSAAAGIDAGDVFEFTINDGSLTQTFTYTSQRDDTLANVITQLETQLNSNASLYAGQGVSVLANTTAGTLAITANYTTAATDADGAPMTVNITGTNDTLPDTQTINVDSVNTSAIGTNPNGSAVSLIDGKYILQSDFSFNETTVGITESNLEENSFIAGTGGITIASTSGDITVGDAIDRPMQFIGGTDIIGGFSLPVGETLTIPLDTTISPITANLSLPPYVGNVDANGVVTTAFTVTSADNAQLEAADFSLGTDKTLTLPVGTSLNRDNPGILTVLPGVNFLDANDHNMSVTITSLTDTKSANKDLTTVFTAMQGSLPSDSTGRLSQSLFSATHASSIDVYDSLGTKHTVRFEFRKNSVSTEGTQWDVKLTVPKPGVINPAETLNTNIMTGTIKFGPDGSLEYFTPTSISYTANNGSAPDQNILIDLGSIGQFDGMTSFDSQSNTSGISQDGYTGGDLSGVRIDETGTVIGSFTNGRSFGLAQVAMASFSNNEGLESDGGNTFIQTSNSGDPIIGQAAVGGRGFVQASALEMSNVDLSRSLTQLIVVQRGFQANSKTITTSDQMLNTLLQLKQ